MVTNTRSPRRTWTIDFKKRVVAEASQPGVSAAEIARRYDLNANLLFNWKKKFGANAVLLPVEIEADEPHQTKSRSIGRPERKQAEIVTIELPNGIRVCCATQIDPLFVGRIVSALRSMP